MSPSTWRAKWKFSGIETAVVKGFFSKINILQDKFLAKNHISQLAAGIGKSWRSMTPLKLKDNGGQNSINFSDSRSLMRKTDFLIFLAFFPRQILSIIMIFEKNPFAQYFLYLKAFILPWRHYVLRFINQPYCDGNILSILQI